MRGNFAGWLALVMVGGFVLRVVYVVAVRHDVAGDWVGGDGAGYHFAANLLADGHGFVLPPQLGAGTHVSAHHPPLWTLLLAFPSRLGLRTWLEQQLFACILGTATIAMVGIAGRRIAGARAGLLAAVIAALYPGLWAYERQLLSETLVLFLVAGLLYLAYGFIERPSTAGAAGLGAACGLVALTRSEQILLVVALVAPLVLLTNVARRRRFGWLAVAGVATLLVILPWTLYNLNRFERPVVLSTSFGAAMAVANCDSVYSGPLMGSYDIRCLVANPCAGLTRRTIDAELPDESVTSARCVRASLDYADAHLRRLPIVALAREGRVWSLFRPFQQTRIDSDWRLSRLWVDRLGLFAYWALIPAAAFGAVVLRRRHVAVYPLLAFGLTTFVAVAITYGETRLRAPSEISIVLLAGIGLDGMVRRLTTRETAGATR